MHFKEKVKQDPRIQKVETIPTAVSQLCLQYQALVKSTRPRKSE
jgi:hypothetical protein